MLVMQSSELGAYLPLYVSRYVADKVGTNLDPARYMMINPIRMDKMDFGSYLAYLAYLYALALPSLKKS